MKEVVRLCLILVFLLASCSREQADQQATSPPTAQIVSRWRSVAETSTEALRASVNALEARVGRFLDQPTRDNLDSLQVAWTDAHSDFLSSRVFLPGQTGELFYRMDGWPLVTGFLDSTPAHPDSGIVNDFTIEINASTLIDQHGITSEREISLGFHALEYFLFSRSLNDYVADDEKLTNLRRRDATRIIAGLLVRDTQRLIQLSREELMGITTDAEAIGIFIKSLQGTGNRLYQEAHSLVETGENHSMFSKTSWNDLRNQLKIISHVTGDPVHLADVFEQLDPRVAANLATTMSQLLEVIESAEPDRERLIPLLAALNHQLDEFVELAP